MTVTERRREGGGQILYDIILYAFVTKQITRKIIIFLTKAAA